MIEKKVKDLMLSLKEYATISKEETIKDALIELNRSQLDLTEGKHHHRAILVLDENKKVVGKLTHWSILKSLEPKIFKDSDQNLLLRSRLSKENINKIEEEFASISTSLSKMCKEASSKKVSEAMVKVTENIDEKASATEAIRLLVSAHSQSTLVTKNGKVVGILRLVDVFEEVAKQIRDS